jgi:hypothetical protein
MRAKKINEVQNFERGIDDPMKAMGIGVSKKRDMVEGMAAFTHWLYNIDPYFIENIWGDTLIAKHLLDKWEGILAKSKETFMDPNSLIKFVHQLDSENREKLYEYIIENHSDKS